tara:strand:+ start:362 stop:565 length:204 start_codon:yes stop_codon:yes gene_type:complete
MNEKDQKITLPVISDDLLKALDGLFPERTPDINMEPKEMYYRIGQRSVVRFLYQKQKEQSENIMEKK